MSGFSDELRAAADPIWQAQLEHPFVRGIGDGSLPIERFLYWVKQDYRFLIEYCRLFALAAARSPDFPTLIAL
ncbi:MAG: thiaminase II, partial [Dehalococcoidia bacterium]